ncbi:hypothetical protein HYW99_03470 [Candidatus Woesearchaeota archaeon]|nr:hypothetical protein [Candidatus Woesearchaeota archaeon]
MVRRQFLQIMILTILNLTLNACSEKYTINYLEELYYNLERLYRKFSQQEIENIRKVIESHVQLNTRIKTKDGKVFEKLGMGIVYDNFIFNFRPYCLFI